MYLRGSTFGDQARLVMLKIMTKPLDGKYQCQTHFIGSGISFFQAYEHVAEVIQGISFFLVL